MKLIFQVKLASRQRAKTIFDSGKLREFFSGSKKYMENWPYSRSICYGFPMRKGVERAVLTVAFRDGVWAVELDGDTFGHSPEKDIAKAAANKRAREVQDDGRPCQVRVSGELGFFAT